MQLGCLIRKNADYTNTTLMSFYKEYVVLPGNWQELSNSKAKMDDFTHLLSINFISKGFPRIISYINPRYCK